MNIIDIEPVVVHVNHRGDWVFLLVHTDAGITELKDRMPFADLTKFEANPVVQDFGNLLTVNDLCRYVESKVGATD